MMIIKSPKRFKAAAVIAAYIPMLSTTPIRASDDTNTINLNVDLVSHSSISLGEPILVHYDIKNVSVQQLALKLGIYGTDWYTLTMRDTKGHIVDTIPDPRPTQPRGAVPTQNITLENNGVSTDYIPVTKRLAITHPGRYMLTVHAKIPYALTTFSESKSVETLTAESDLVLVQDFTFPIVITKFDANRLHATAEALRQTAAKEQNSSLAQAETDALFSMPEKQAATSWKRLALQPGTSADAVADELFELHSITGVDILLSMYDTPMLSHTSISNRLNKLYNESDAALKTHIKSSAVQRGINLSKKAPNPLIVD